MAQNSITVSTTPPLQGLAMVNDINAAFQSLSTDFSGATDPAQHAAPFSTWADTGNMQLKRRNATNDGWVIEGTLLRESLPQYSTLPTTDKGDVHLIGVGPHRWGSDQGEYIQLTATIAQINTIINAHNSLKVDVEKFQQVTIYPNGGTEAEPADVSIDTSYVMDNPFGNAHVVCSALILNNGRWGETGWIYASGGFGVSAKWRSDSKIVVQTGSTCLMTSSRNSGNPHQFAANEYSPTPCKVVVQTFGVQV